MQIKIPLTGFLVFLAGFLFSQNSPMDAASVNRLKTHIEESAGRTNTITANFTQEKEMSILDEKIRSSGKFYFKRERLLRWEYTTPYSYLIIINNDRITVRDESKTSHFDSRGNNVFSEVNRIIVGSIRGTLLYDEQNFRQSYLESSNAFIVKLVPLSAGLKSSLREITLYFNKQDYSVDRLDITENTGDKTVIVFSGKVFNEPLADEKFSAR